MIEPHSLSPAPLDPTARELDTSSVYTPTRRGTFISAMLGTLRASPMRLYSYGAGNLPQRLITVFADELEKLSVAFDNVIVRAIHESTFRAWEHPEFFPTRLAPTVARGLLRVSVPYPLTQSEVIPRGSLFGSRDGRTLRSEREVVINAGETSAMVPVVSEVIGSAGNFLPGSVTIFLSGRTSFMVTNPAAISGGRDPETFEERRVRFQDMVESRATASRLSLYSAAHNTAVADAVHSEVQERPTDVAVVIPWEIGGWNGEMSYGYVVVDTGGGSATPEYLAALQSRLERVQAAGDLFTAVACNPWVVRPTLEVATTRLADPASVRRALADAWQRFSDAHLIEDGRGRGRASLFDLRTALDSAHPDIVSVRITSHDGDLQPPVGSRLIAGQLSATLLPGGLL